MQAELAVLKPYVHGFVFGILTSHQQIDGPRCKTLTRLAEPLPCTLHRAFDHATDAETSLETAIDCGFRSILTSGGPHDAVQGVETLKRLQKAADGRIEIIAGGGVRRYNLAMLLPETGVNAVHTAAITSSDEERANPAEIHACLSILRSTGSTNA